MQGFYNIPFASQLEKLNLPLLTNCQKRGFDYGIKAAQPQENLSQMSFNQTCLQGQEDMIKNFPRSIPTQGYIANYFLIRW